MKKFLALGLMSGTSIDGIDISLVETDGVSLKRMNYNFTHYYSKETNQRLEKITIDRKLLRKNCSRKPAPLPNNEQLT